MQFQILHISECMSKIVFFLILLILISLEVEVNFNDVSYTVLESEGQVNIYLRISGKYFVPLHAIIEIIDGTARSEQILWLNILETNYTIII